MRKYRKYAIIFFLVITTVLYVMYAALIQSMIMDQKERYRYLAVNESNYIISCVDKVVVRSYMLREMVIENDGDIGFFDKIAESMYESVEEDTGVALRNIAVATKNVVSKVSPVEGNEAFLRFDYTDSSKLGNQDAIEAYKKGKTIITNPFDLVQGGVGMAIRTPVYIQEGESKRLWGMVTATMDFDNLLDAFNLDNLRKMQLDYRLWYVDENGNKVVIEETNARMKSAISESFYVYNLNWHLDIEPVNGWYSVSTDIIAKVVIVAVSFCLSMIILLVLRIKEDGQKMKLIAEQDSLTHCYSRHYLNSEILDSETVNWKDAQHCYSVAIIDVDHFKDVNDSFGHSVGDWALVSIAKLLQSEIKPSKGDRVVRYGGDEFIICFNDVTLEELEETISEMVDKVQEIHLDAVPELSLTISVGAAYNNRKLNYSYNEIIQTADLNLYNIKESGRNNYQIS